METRKVMRLGRSSLVASLPKDWIRLSGLKHGDKVYVEIQKNGSLQIFPSEAKERGEQREIEIEVGPTEYGLLMRKIISCYLDGFRQIKLISKHIFTEPQQELIRKLCWKLYVRTLDASTKEITLQSIADLGNVALDTSIRRMANISFNMCENSFNALINYDLKLANATILLDEEVDNFSFLLLRLLRSTSRNVSLLTKTGLELCDCFDYQTVVDRIEHLADNSVNISKCINLLHSNGKMLSQQLTEELVAIGKEALNLSSNAIKNFLTKNLEAANNIIELKNTLKEKLIHEMIIQKIFREKDPVSIYAACSIKDSILRITEIAADISEAAINKTIRHTQELS